MNVFPILGRTVLFLVLLFPLFITAQNADQLYINEINYRAVEKQQNIDFVEIYNPGSQTIDLSGWFLTGGLKYTFPGGSSISSGSYIVIAADPSVAQSVFGGTGFLGPWEGKLSSSEDNVSLRTPDYEVIDKVDYKAWQEWPNVRFDDYVITLPIPQNNDYLQNLTIKVAKSIQKINPSLDGKHAGSWSAAAPTPKQQNSNYSSNTSLPVVKSVSKSPDKPLSTEDVRIKVDFENHFLYNSNLNVTLEYQVNNAGAYKVKSDVNYNSSFLSIPMLDDGIPATSGDSTANNGIYTAIIPAKLHRALIRYKIKVESTGGYVRYFPDPNHNEDNYSYYVYDGDADFQGNSFATLNPMQNITILTKTSITDEYISTGDDPDQYDGYEYLGEGTLIYNGKIFDHINFRPRGKTRNNRIKPGIKFKLNKEKGILLEDDCGDDYDEERDNLILSGTWVNDEGSHGLVESLVYKILELTGGWYNNTDYVNLRIVDHATEAGLNGDFWGLFLIIEDNNGELLKEHDLPDGNIWTTYDPDGAGRFMYVDYFGDFPGYDDPTLWITDTGGNISETPDSGTVLKDMLFGDWIGNEFWANGEDTYYEKHSYREYYNPELDQWVGWCKDYDGAFGSGNNVEGVSTTHDANVNENIRQPLNIPTSLEEEYKSALRSAIDLLLNTEQINFLIDSELEKIYDPAAAYDWTTLDHDRWISYQTYHEGNVDLQFAWYKTWFQDRKSYLLSDAVHGILDTDIPNKPTISFTGSTTLDDIKFSNSPFFDPQGASTFAAREWRVGEWSDPSNPYYDTKCEPKYEIETKWSSGELASGTTFQIPSEANLKAGRTYKIRMRYKDASGRWSHWSDAHKIIPTSAPAASCDLVINEIMYNPSQRFTEFIEIHNIGPTTISLDNFKMTEGVDYDFPSGSSILADEYIILAEDSCEFFNIHGFYPFGEYSASLSDGGEYLELTGPYRTICDSLTYDDANDWPETADNGFYSLAFKEEQIDNAIPGNWGIQPLLQTPGVQNDLTNFGQHDYSGIVINEIHYNPFPDPVTGDSGKKFEFIELKNIGITDINLTGAFFSLGIVYYFPDNTIISPGDFIVLAEDKSSFEDRYNFAPFDKFDGALSNDGETILLNDKNGIILDAVTYGVGFPWDPEANGGADDYSLALIDGNYNNETRLNWKTQCDVLYTPGAENDFSCFTGLGLTGLTITEFSYTPNNTEFIEIYNNSNSPYSLEEVKLSSAIDYNFPNLFLAPGQFVVLANDASVFQNTYGVAPFGEYNGGLNSNGETILLKDLFGVTLDSVSYGVASPWNAEPKQGIKSLALIDADLDNNIAESWCVQDVNVTPKAINTFSDSDADSIIDCLDQCPGQSDSNIGTVCNDGDPCTSGETYDANCNCTGGSFIDSDGDGVCDFDDACPGINDNLIGTACDDSDPCTSGEVYDSNCNCSGGTIDDADGDGVCDLYDICPGFDDTVDSDNDGLADGCDSVHCPAVDETIMGTSCNDPCYQSTVNTSCDCLPVTNLALQGTASMSSTLNSYIASNLNDGIINNNTSSLVHTTSATTTEWVQIDLGNSYQISTVAIKNRTSCCSERLNNTYVMISSSPFPNNNDVFASLANADFIYQVGDANAIANIGIDINMNGRYVRIQKSGNNETGNALNLKELQIFSIDTTPILKDADNDGVCDTDDICPGSDDTIDSNNNGIPDGCEGCENYITEMNFPNIVSDAQANINITTNGKVQVGATVDYSAGSDIDLMPGFEVELGSLYHAYIQPCN